MTTMTKKRTAELEGAQLDWAVAMACGYKHVKASEVYLGEWQRTNKPNIFVCWFKPSREWGHGGPIIERELIEITHDRDYKTDGSFGRVFEARATFAWLEGDTPLIAAMRAFVASKLGDEVEVPV